jgi:hypothetical protein
VPEFSRPAEYLDKLLFAQRTVKAASFRTDQKQAIRELCEGLAELIVALIEREQGGKSKPADAAPELPE